MFKNKSKLSRVERKYCSCLVKVRSKKIPNPYGICTNSVYGSRNISRKKAVGCSKYYNLNKLKKEQLKNLAREKKLSLKSNILKKDIIELLKRKII
jgi:hypothetical protein